MTPVAVRLFVALLLWCGASLLASVAWARVMARLDKGEARRLAAREREGKS